MNDNPTNVRQPTTKDKIVFWLIALEACVSFTKNIRRHTSYVFD